MNTKQLTLLLVVWASAGACGDGGGTRLAPDTSAADAARSDTDATDADAIDSGATDTADDAADDVPADTRGDAHDSDAPDAEPWTWTPWEPGADAPDVRTERLCVQGADTFGDEPGDAAIFIDCETDGGRYAPADLPPVDELVVAAYNIERGFHIDEIIALLASGEVPRPDIVLISESDRGCERTGYRDITRDLARALQMDFAYATEFVELPRGNWPADSACEHGNAILSRYPLGNVQAVRHAANRSWYQGPDDRAGGEPRLGGRIAVTADVQVGASYVHVAVVHFESHPNDAVVRDAQAAEMALDGLAQPHLAIVGGDMNAPLYWVDLQSGGASDGTTQAFLSRGFVDAHASLPYDERPTSRAFVIDLIMGTADVFSSPAVCPLSVCGGLSDHQPVWATVRLP